MGVLFIGALPEPRPSSGPSLLIPFTCAMSPARGMLLMIPLYVTAEYGGSISATLLSTPGTTAAATAIDGDEMSQKGRATVAISISLTA
ncbi:tripartite tricarboxylate transporter permease [Frigidibacter sp. MR17.24]|uniref:tripartite tricarboxylate transporter permease n=1 Tax=Frigidibacter sp. MR17.24 TaxID=3127345 RepID=UPI0030131021